MTSGITAFTMVKDITTKLNLHHQYSIETPVTLTAQYQIKQGCQPSFNCFKPNTHYGYSNTNYNIAAMIIEKYFKTSYSQALQNYILKPFSTRYHQSVYYTLSYNQAQLANMVHGYVGQDSAQQFNNPGLKPGMDMTKLNLSIYGPAGALTGSVSGLSLLSRSLLSNDLFHSKQALLHTGCQPGSATLQTNCPKQNRSRVRIIGLLWSWH